MDLTTSVAGGLVVGLAVFILTRWYYQKDSANEAAAADRLRLLGEIDEQLVSIQSELTRLSESMNARPHPVTWGHQPTVEQDLQRVEALGPALQFHPEVQKALSRLSTTVRDVAGRADASIRWVTASVIERAIAGDRYIKVERAWSASWRHAFLYYVADLATSTSDLRVALEHWQRSGSLSTWELPTRPLPNDRYTAETIKEATASSWAAPDAPTA